MARRAETRSCCVRCLCVCKVLLNAGGYFLVYAQSKCKGSRQAMKGWGKEKRKEDGDTKEGRNSAVQVGEEGGRKSAVRRSLGRSLFRLQGTILLYTSSIQLFKFYTYIYIQQQYVSVNQIPCKISVNSIAPFPLSRSKANNRP